MQFTNIELVLDLESPPTCPFCKKAGAVEATSIEIVDPPPVLVFEAFYAQDQDESSTSPFRINQEIIVTGRTYRHLVSIMSWKEHFWTVVSHNGGIWLGETSERDSLDGQLTYVGAGEYITEATIEGEEVMPEFHIYGTIDDRICMDLPSEIDGDLRPRTRTTRSKRKSNKYIRT